jgi:hypothetical protein
VSCDELTGGTISESLGDYATVRDLIADLVAESVDATVKPEIREVVETMRLRQHVAVGRQRIAKNKSGGAPPSVVRIRR